jgi:hypothetical protein
VTIATDFLTYFTEGWAQHLAASSLGLTWKPSAPYASSEIGIWLLALPTDPAFDTSAAVALTPYPLSADPTYADSTIGLQIKTRVPSQDPRAAWAIDGPIANLILGNWPLTLPNGVQIETLLDGATSTSLGIDDKRRITWSSSYPFRVYRPGAHRL